MKFNLLRRIMAMEDPNQRRRRSVTMSRTTMPFKQVRGGTQALNDLQQAAELLREYAGKVAARKKLREVADAIESAVQHLKAAGK